MRIQLECYYSLSSPWMYFAGPQVQDLVRRHRALWVEERDTSQPEVRIAVANENGYDGAALQQMEQAPPVQAEYGVFTREAVERGIFGAPIFVLNGERFWGQDRLAFVDRALDKLRGGNPA